MNNNDNDIYFKVKPKDIKGTTDNDFHIEDLSINDDASGSILDITNDDINKDLNNEFQLSNGNRNNYQAPHSDFNNNLNKENNFNRSNSLDNDSKKLGDSDRLPRENKNKDILPNNNQNQDKSSNDNKDQNNKSNSDNQNQDNNKKQSEKEKKNSAIDQKRKDLKDKNRNNNNQIRKKDSKNNQHSNTKKNNKNQSSSVRDKIGNAANKLKNGLNKNMPKASNVSGDLKGKIGILKKIVNIFVKTFPWNLIVIGAMFILFIMIFLASYVGSVNSSAADYNCIPVTSELSYSSAGDIIKGEPVVVLKDSSATNINSLKTAKSLYGTDTNPMQLARYVMGVTYAEIDNVNEEALKAQMIAAKSFLLGRTQNDKGQKGSIGMGFTPDYTNTQTIFYIRGNVNDQDFCDIYEGCQNGIYSKTTWSNWTGEGYNNRKPALSAENIKKFEKCWEETVNEYVYDDVNKVFAGQFYNNYNNACHSGSCFAQQTAISYANKGSNYKDILFNKSYGAYSETRFTMYNAETEYIAAVTTDCTPSSSSGLGCGVADDKFIYYDQKNYEQSFCGTDETIATSGCGVTSMAMVISNLTDTVVDPLYTSDEAKDANNGYCGDDMGKSYEYFSYSAPLYNLTYESIPKTSDGAKQVLDIINKGGLVIAHVGALSPFTTGDHYIVIRKAMSSGKVLVGDPNHSEFMNNEYDVNDFVDNSWLKTGWYGFTGPKSDEIVKNYCVFGGTGEAGVATGYLGNPLDPNDTTRKYAGKDFPRYSDGTGHAGIDLNASTASIKEGDPVYAMDGGVVKTVGTCAYNRDDSRYYSASGCPDANGLGIYIDHGNGYTTNYLHFKSRINGIKVGTKIKKGQLIGYIGKTGNASGVHLHISLYKNDLLQNNGGYMTVRAMGKEGLGFLNPAKYINSSNSYVGKTK